MMKNIVNKALKYSDWLEEKVPKALLAKNFPQLVKQLVKESDQPTELETQNELVKIVKQEEKTWGRTHN